MRFLAHGTWPLDAHNKLLNWFARLAPHSCVETVCLQSAVEFGRLRSRRQTGRVRTSTRALSITSHGLLSLAVFPGVRTTVETYHAYRYHVLTYYIIRYPYF